MNPFLPWARPVVHVIAALALAGCTSSSDAPAPPRLLVVGLDGADLRMVDRLAEAGRIPNLAGLQRRGVSARLRTVSNASPVVWTSIATGVRPAKHTIRGFLRNGRPVASTMRERPAFWNILSHYGRTVGVVAWWATFPAESVNGYVVSPYVIFTGAKPGRSRVLELWRGGGAELRRTHPPELHARIAAAMKTSGDVDPAAMRDVYADDERTTQTPWVVARDDSYRDVARSLMATTPVETVAVYLQGIDVASHDLSRWVFGKNVNEKRDPRVEEEEVRAAKERVDAMYARVDRIVGEILDGVGDRTDVIVVSDHGWEYDGTGHLNFNPGIFVAAGPSFRRGARVADISVLDVLPLVLAILEVPLSRDLDGRVPLEVFADGAHPEIRRVDEYPIGPASLPENVTSEAPDDREMVERLRGLGYIE